jgi:hypothetical protein
MFPAKMPWPMTQRVATRGKGATRVGGAGGQEALARETHLVGAFFQHKGEEGRVMKNANGHSNSGL